MTFCHLLLDAAQASQFRHVPENFPAGFVCSCCGEAIHLPNPGKFGGTGYARTPDDRLICYPCADSAQRAELLDRSKSFGAYLSGDGRHVTTWTGGILARVTEWNPCRLTRRSHWHGKEYRSIHVIDVHVGHWHGRGSPGLALTLRPCNQPLQHAPRKTLQVDHYTPHGTRGPAVADFRYRGQLVSTLAPASSWTDVETRIRELSARGFTHYVYRGRPARRIERSAA